VTFSANVGPPSVKRGATIALPVRRDARG
jgi:hypothetical protein